MTSPPEPCRWYNGGHCRRGDDNCKYLHICEDYITGNCRPGCRNGLNHQLNVRQVKRVLGEAGINPNQSKDALLAELTGRPDSNWDDDDNSYSDHDSDERDDSYESDDSEESEEEPEICIFHLRGCCKFGYRCKNRHELPDNWTHTVWKPYETITLNKRSHEYAKVKTHFSDAMEGENAEVKSIMRVQNPQLWGKFDAKRRDMENDYELQLYHGTRQANVHSICLNGFDPDRAGENTDVPRHGRGSYFTSQACYAARGEFQDPDNKVVFLVDVLVGNYTKGNRIYTSAPEGYDTCVDRVNKPTKYVKFDKHSSYPSYVLYFR